MAKSPNQFTEPMMVVTINRSVNRMQCPEMWNQPKNVSTECWLFIVHYFIELCTESTEHIEPTYLTSILMPYTVDLAAQSVKIYGTCFYGALGLLRKNMKIYRNLLAVFSQAWNPHWIYSAQSSLYVINASAFNENLGEWYLVTHIICGSIWFGISIRANIWMGDDRFHGKHVACVQINKLRSAYACHKLWSDMNSFYA